MKLVSIDQELESLKIVLHAIEPLDDAQRRFVLKTVAERMGVSMAPACTPTDSPAHAGGTVPTEGQGARTGAAESSASLDSQTAKQFIKSKSPKTDVQRVACLAYYLTHARDQPHFKTLDLTRLNTEAGGAPFSNASLAVGNATSQNKFLGSVGQGKKQITSLGEDVVAALPDQEKAKAEQATLRKPRKRKLKKAQAKIK